jgi:hypothetical protein
LLLFFSCLAQKLAEGTCGWRTIYAMNFGDKTPAASSHISEQGGIWGPAMEGATKLAAQRHRVAFAAIEQDVPAFKMHFENPSFPYSRRKHLIFSVTCAGKKLLH